MGDRWNLSLGQEFGNGNAEGHMHGDGKYIFDNQYTDFKPLHILIQGTLQILRQIADSLRQQRAAAVGPPQLVIDPFVFRVVKIRFRNAHTYVGSAVQATGIPETHMVIFPQNLCPFSRLQRDPIGACEARGHETYIL